MAKNKAKKLSLYDHKGLPIAALALAFLLVFLLVTINLTSTKDQSEVYVQGVSSAKSTSLIPTVDAIIRQIEALLKEDNAFGDNLNDLNNVNNLQ